MNPTESTFAAGSTNQPVIGLLQQEAFKNSSKNDVAFDVDHDHGTPTASNRFEKIPGIDSTQQNCALGDFLSRLVKVEMLNGDTGNTEVSPLLTATHDAHEDESPPISKVQSNFPFNPPRITQPSIQESEEGEKEDNQQRMVSSTNAEYNQPQSGVYLSVPLAATTTHKKALPLTLTTVRAMIVMVHWALFSMLSKVKTSLMMTIVMMTLSFSLVLLFCLISQRQTNKDEFKNDGENKSLKKFERRRKVGSLY